MILVVLLIGLALSKASAAEERPVRINAACGAADGLLVADSHSGPLPSFNLADPFDSLIPSQPLLADTPCDGLLPSLDSLSLALAFLVPDPSVSVLCRRHCPAGWPATAAGRLTWLQHFLF
jgi:hypothetical protein